MAGKIKTTKPSLEDSESAMANKTEPHFEVTCRFLLPDNDEQFRDVMNGPRWKALVRVILHTLTDWRDYSEGQESKAYDCAIKCLRDEMAANGLTLADPDLIEEGYRRVRTFWAQRIAKRDEMAEKAGNFSGSSSRAQVEKLVSSGETEAEKAALDFAMDNGLAHGGSCREGRPSEDGSLHERYQLVEMSEAKRPHILERNIADSDATVVITVGLEFAGLGRIGRLARKHGKPWLHVSGFAAGQNAAPVLKQFIEGSRSKVLNILALSSYQEPDAADFVRELLSKALPPSQNRHQEEFT